ncbi:hypothetical protein [Anseongella ginsenosidimutans]|uniref:hypothetical protein n=1 Tax=Anseongella ginsenosidimutans TaxID=496056 RepID=UPI001315A017|nr:hypothetical protein [Anseongella ginsenosidimutans]
MKEICRLIQDNFGLAVSLPDTLLGNRLFNGTFPANDAEVLLKALMTTYNLEVAENGGGLQLRRKPVPPGNQGR